MRSKTAFLAAVALAAAAGVSGVGKDELKRTADKVLANFVGGAARSERVLEGGSASRPANASASKAAEKKLPKTSEKIRKLYSRVADAGK